MKNGFTLVELSIVLVIIGLLVGGILVGQSLIESAKIQSYVRKLQQFEVAAQQFTSKYRSIPGDSRLFTPAGDGDRILEWNAGCNGSYSPTESNQYWAHLSQAQMIKSTYQAYQPLSCIDGTHGAWYDMADITNPTLAESAYWKGVSGATGKKIPMIVYSSGVWGGYLDVLPMLALDNKFDDGNVATGNLVTFNDINFDAGGDGNPCSLFVAGGGNSSTVCAFQYTSQVLN